VSKLIHRVWPATGIDAQSFITAALLGLCAYGFFVVSQLIF
jgi:hypothetical protein